MTLDPSATRPLLAVSTSESIYHDAEEYPFESTTNDAENAPGPGGIALIDAIHANHAESTGAVDLESEVFASPMEALPPTVPTKDLLALTPLRAHYLKKSLITLQFSYELDAISSSQTAFSNLSPLSYLGHPFTPPPKGAPRLDMPLLRYMFRQFVLTFPFVASAPAGFFPQKLQPFVGSLLSRNLSTTEDVLGMDDPGVDPELASRQKLLGKAEKYFALLLGSATKLVEEEEVVRLTQKDLDRLEAIAKKRAMRAKRLRDAFDVNIVCVRTVVEKKKMQRSRVHEEFIIRTRRARMTDVFVARRYGDFKTLADELRKAHPEQAVKSPPPKDRTALTVPTSTYTPQPSSAPVSTQPSGENTAPALFHRSDTINTTGSADSYLGSGPSSSSSANASRLAREKNRVTLRAYIHSLMTSATIASSPVLKSFLLSGPTRLTPEEEVDAKRREEADHVRGEGRRQFAAEIATRVDGLRNSVRAVKGDMMGKNGLTRIFAAVKQTPNVKDLPREYQAVIEWGRITLAATIFQTFVASDTASETLAGLKRIHGLMPYFMLKGILRVSNPMAMIRGVLDLFLAQPFGGKSLLQRMFTSNLTEEAKNLQEDINMVRETIGDDDMCEKVCKFVYASKEFQSILRDDAVTENFNLLTIILRSAEQPLLSRPQMQRVIRAAKAHNEYLRYRENLVDSDDDDGPQDEDGWLYEDLNVLAKLYTQLRDKEQLIDLIFEGTTADLLKDMITIFYSPLAKVYKAASITDSISDLQNFVNDLIRTVEGVDDSQDAHKAVQTFVNLVQRHEQAFYSFVHKVHSKGEDLFEGLMHWIELFLTLTREGLGHPTSLEFLLPHAGEDRESIMKEIDEVALYHYKLKVAYEEKVRRRFGRAEGQSAADQDDEAAQELVNGVVRELSFGELVKADANDIAAVESDEETDSEEEEYTTEESSEEGSDSDTPPPPLPQRRPRLPISPQHPPQQQQKRSLTPTTTSGGRDSIPPVPPLPPGYSPAPTQPRHSNHRSLDQNQHHSNLHTPTHQHVANANGSPVPVRPTPPRLRTSKSFSHDSSSSGPVSAPPVEPKFHLPKSSGKDLHSAPRSAGLKPPSNPVSRKGSPGYGKVENNPAHPYPITKRKRKKNGVHFETPELEHIPKLLPLFMEMIRPLLRTRTL